MSQDLRSALIAGGVSLLFSIIYWCRNTISKKCRMHKKFKKYKKYAIGFLEKHIEYLNTGELKYFGKKYNPNDITYSIRSEKYIGTIPMTKHSFLAINFALFTDEEFLFPLSERVLLLNVLTFMSPTMYICISTIYNEVTKEALQFDSIAINYNNNILSFIHKDYYITEFNAKYVDFTKLYEELKSNKFDERIKKVISNNIY